MLRGRERVSVLVEVRTWDDGRDAGVEKLATEGGSEGLAAEAAPVVTISHCVDPCGVQGHTTIKGMSGSATLGGDGSVGYEPE